MRHAYHRAQIEMRTQHERAERTGKIPFWFLEDDHNWIPVPMDSDFWRIIAGGLRGIAYQLQRDERIEERLLIL